MNIQYLTGKHSGSDIFVLGSGVSLDYIPKSFWNNRITIGVNLVFQSVKTKYLVCHHHLFCQEIVNAGMTLVTSEHDTCIYGRPQHAGNQSYIDGDYYVYKHPNQGYTQIDISYFNEPEYLIAGGTIITTAIHLAYRMGAKCIFLAGVDGGLIDGKTNISTYKNPTNKDHFENTQSQLVEISNHIRQLGVPVMSINPWIDFGLEGHKFTK